MTAELTRLIGLSKIDRTGVDIVVRATSEECAALAARMAVPAIGSLECFYRLTAEGNGATIFARGRLRAQVTRVCVISAEDFETSIDDEFEIRFVPAGTETDDPDPDLPDEIPYQGDTIDLGQAAAEQLGLALDPYPRMPGAALPDTADDQTISPFSALSHRIGRDKTRH
jgi:hypothetical protein